MRLSDNPGELAQIQMGRDVLRTRVVEAIQVPNPLTENTCKIHVKYIYMFTYKYTYDPMDLHLG